MARVVAAGTVQNGLQTSGPTDGARTLFAVQASFCASSVVCSVGLSEHRKHETEKRNLQHKKKLLAPHPRSPCSDLNRDRDSEPSAQPFT